jgi:hypothetical protein
MGRRGGSDQPAAAGSVIDDEGLMQQRRQKFREQPGKCVGGSAGRRRRDDPYGTGRPLGTGCDRHRQKGQEPERCEPASSHQLTSISRPWYISMAFFSHSSCGSGKGPVQAAERRQFRIMEAKCFNVRVRRPLEETR